MNVVDATCKKCSRAFRLLIGNPQFCSVSCLRAAQAVAAVREDEKKRRGAK